MIYSKEVDNMCVVAKGPNHGPLLNGFRRDLE